MIMTYDPTQSSLRLKVSDIPNSTLLLQGSQYNLDTTGGFSTVYFHVAHVFDLWLNAVLKAKLDLGGTVDNVLPADFDFDDTLEVRREDDSISNIANVYQVSLTKIKELDDSEIYQIEDLGNGLFRVYTEGIGDRTIRVLSGTGRLLTWVHGYVYGMASGIFV